MKILLVVAQPGSQSFGLSSLFLFEPLTLEYIGAGVSKNHDVRILDLRVDTELSLKKNIESFQPDIIGCGAYTMEVNSAKQVLQEAKKIHPEILTVVGGIHATVMPSDFFEEYIDVVVKGEGVHPFRKICERHETRKSFADIGNIYYRKNGQMVFTHEEPYPHLDTLPFPDRSLTAHVRHKYQTLLADKPACRASIRGSIGCYFRCKFCSVSAMMKQKIYTRSVDNIIQELAMIDEKYMLWVDDELMIDPKWTVALATEIYKSGIKKSHVCCGRSDAIVKHPEVVEAWAKAGMDYLFIGMEGFRDKDLNEMRKATNVSKNDEAVRVCHQFGVKVRGGFIVMPDFEKKDFRNMSKYVKASGVDWPSYSVYTPLPGTDLWTEKEAELITRNYDHFDLAHPVLPTKIPLKQFYKEFFKLIGGSMSLGKKIKFIMSMNPQFRKHYFTAIKEVKRRFKEFGESYMKS